MLKDLCVCEILDKQAATKIKVYSEKKKFRKYVTVIDGIDKSQLDQTTKDLKTKLACAGTSKDGIIILQGEHKMRVAELLKKLGYPEDSIEVR